MLRRLFLVLQSIFSLPPIIFLFFWLMSGPYSYFGRDTSVNYLWFVLTLTPYGLIILGKYIIYGKLYIFKIGEGPRSWEEEIGGRWKKGRGRWNKEKGEEK